jgi:hypothetical protein
MEQSVFHRCGTTRGHTYMNFSVMLVTSPNVRVPVRINLTVYEHALYYPRFRNKQYEIMLWVKC